MPIHGFRDGGSIPRMQATSRMTEEQAKSILTAAGWKVLATKPLIDGYGYRPHDSRFWQSLPRSVWWFLKTEAGWIEMGWRKRVIAIEWEDTGIRCVVTDDAVTKSPTGVHAYSTAKAVEYLTALRETYGQDG